MKAGYRVNHSTLHGKYVCWFLLNGRANRDERGTAGTGCKLYDSYEKADAAGKRYLKKMQKNGFII